MFTNSNEKSRFALYYENNLKNNSDNKKIITMMMMTVNSSVATRKRLRLHNKKKKKRQFQVSIKWKGNSAKSFNFVNISHIFFFLLVRSGLGSILVEVR